MIITARLAIFTFAKFLKRTFVDDKANLSKQAIVKY